MDDKVQFFKTVTNNISCSSKDLIEFSELFIKKDFSNSDFFIREGYIANSLGFVAKGIMRAYISDDEGKEANLRFILENDFISGSFAQGVPSSMNIQCLNDCSIYISDWKSTFQFLNTHNSFRKFFNQLLATGHSRITQRLSSYIRNVASERYKLFLKEYPNLINYIPHYHVANFIGVTSVQLSRIRRKLVTEKK